MGNEKFILRTLQWVCYGGVIYTTWEVVGWKYFATFAFILLYGVLNWAEGRVSDG